MLPKVPMPCQPRDLRPIAVGSAAAKVFSKMLLAAIAEGIAPQGPAQCAAPRRQTSDYLYTLWRMMEMSREWGTAFAAVKLDLHKAFDCLDRDMLLRKIRPLVTCEAEFVCWQGLSLECRGILQTPWGVQFSANEQGHTTGFPRIPRSFRLHCRPGPHGSRGGV